MEENFFDENAPKKLPSSLNVLTILTFIGCAIFLILAIMGFFGADANVAQLEKTMNDPNMANAPEFMKSMMSPEALEMAKKQAANKVPLLGINIIGILLCFFGALEMRKQKKQGYLVYVLGQVVPIAASAIFLGVGMFKGMALIFLAFPILFIILYTVNKKHLTN